MTPTGTGGPGADPEFKKTGEAIVGLNFILKTTTNFPEKGAGHKPWGAILKFTTVPPVP